MERCGTSVQGNITQPALAQMAEIVALTKALQLSEGKRVKHLYRLSNSCQWTTMETVFYSQYSSKTERTIGRTDTSCPREVAVRKYKDIK